MRFIAMAAAPILLACQPEGAPAPRPADGPGRVVSAQVARDLNDAATRIVGWETAPAGLPVTVSVQRGHRNAPFERIGESRTEAALVFKVTPPQRTYFTVAPSDNSAAGVVTALRVLPLEGGRNFRDVGGYRTADGRTVRWGQVFRSGVLHGLTADDYRFVGDLGIKTVVDFRATEERLDEPTEWIGAAPEFVEWDYSANDGAAELFAVLTKPGVTPADVTAIMTQFYSQIFYEHADKYRALFDRLATTDAPLAFHCSAGKDRTGGATALLLAALGVSRDVIVEDYALSEEVVDFMAEFEVAADEQGSPYAFLAQLPPDVVRPLMRSDPAYIEAALAQLEADHGSVLNFIQTELGVDDQKLTRLRDRLLTD